MSHLRLPCGTLVALFAASLLGAALPSASSAQTPESAPANATEGAPPPAQAPSEASVHRRRPASRWARAELASVQTLVGAAVGAELCGIASCDAARPWAASVLLGAGAGLTLSLLTTRDGIAEGRAQAINAGTLFGTWLGMGTFASTAGSDPNTHVLAGMALGGQLLGAGLGMVADDRLTLTAGEVSLANSGALLIGVTSLLGLIAVNPDADGDPLRRRFFGTTLITTSLGLAGGAWLARVDHVSRGRALMVDAGAIAGGGMLPLLGWFVRGDKAQSEALLWSSVAGSVGGAITAYVFTRGWDGPQVPNVSMSVSPTEGGGVAQLTYRL